jgi:hypothetical protein
MFRFALTAFSAFLLSGCNEGTAFIGKYYGGRDVSGSKSGPEVIINEDKSIQLNINSDLNYTGTYYVASTSGKLVATFKDLPAKCDLVTSGEPSESVGFLTFICDSEKVAVGTVVKENFFKEKSEVRRQVTLDCKSDDPRISGLVVKNESSQVTCLNWVENKCDQIHSFFQGREDFSLYDQDGLKYDYRITNIYKKYLDGHEYVIEKSYCKPEGNGGGISFCSSDSYQIAGHCDTVKG